MTENWEEAMEGCFSMNKVNRVSFGTYYPVQLKSLKQMHLEIR